MDKRPPYITGEGVASFHQNFDVSWGHDHVLALGHGGTRIQLTMDEHSVWIRVFSNEIEAPERDSTAVVTTYYLHSHTPLHDEVDFEFLGGSKKTILQTNVYTNGVGGREQRIHLWFDPTSDFHSYSILWNHYQLVFYIDNIPIRVFKNNTRLGVGYPTQGMMIEGLYGMEKEGPFKAIYEGFKIEGCPSEGPIISQECETSKYWWNGEKFRQLDPVQQRAYENVRRKYVNYDYCNDRWRYPEAPLECQEK
ncbi:hypothetical protein AAG906_006433 [Vitis piasezkii]